MDSQSWNKFVILNSSPASFLQSWQWGEFQEALGNTIYRLSLPLPPPGGGGIKGEGGIGLQALIIARELPLGRSYLEIPKGPVVISLLPSPDEGRVSAGGGREGSVWNTFLEKLKDIGKQEKAVLARINPPYSSTSSPWTGEERGEGEFKKPEILLRQTEPEDTVLVDLSKSEDELMQNMHEKSRYNIRLAQKKGVKVRVATDDEKAFEKFLELLDETTKRDGITSWPQERFWQFREKFMINNSSQPPLTLRGGVPSLNIREGEGELLPKAELLIGEYQGRILAAAIIMLFGDAGTYLYAASSAENRPANAPSLVLWEAIKLAKARGKKWYDMWGIAPAGAGENHPWAGITRFKSRYVKLGVTGREVRNVGTRDLILDKKFFTLFKLAKKFKL